MDEFWETNLILRTLSGSRAHGLAREGSDTDTRGVCIPPARVLIGLTQFEQHESEGGDHVTYSLEKFVRLALKGNPNIMESLYCHAEDFLFLTDAGRRILQDRDCFLSKQVGQRFLGYALAQLKRMERHHRWLRSPPSCAPDPATYGAQEVGGRMRFPDADQQKAHEADFKHWQHFKAWRRDRNPSRAALEEQYGYDTKHAMHLIRLLKMGDEVLTLGQVIVRRPDAEWLLGIRDGALEYVQLMELAARMTATLERKLKTSQLSEHPDRAKAEGLLVELQLEALSRT